MLLLRVENLKNLQLKLSAIYRPVTCWVLGVFRRFRPVAKSACWFFHFRPSARIYRRGSTGRISMNFDTGGLLRNSVQKIRIWLKQGKNIGHSTQRSNQVLLSSTNKFAIKRCCSTLSIFKLWCVTCSSTVHGKGIVAFS